VGLEISNAVRHKLSSRHNVTEDEISECFDNRDGKFLTDTREEHKTSPLSQWFIAETDKGKLLKVVFMYYEEGKRVVIKSCFTPNSEEIRIYNKFK
jgi:hypothetical protein